MFKYSKQLCHNFKSIIVRKGIFGLTLQTTTRLYNSSAFNSVHPIKKLDNGLSLKFFEEEHKFHFVWLRDHCRCDKCFNTVTQQRQVDTHQGQMVTHQTMRVVGCSLIIMDNPTVQI